MQLQERKVGWLGLERIINDIIRGVNGNEPIEGAGIRVTQTNRGKIIEVASADGKQPTGSNQATGGGGTAQTATIIAFDQDMNPITLSVLVSADPQSSTAANWLQVGLMDSTTCAATPKNILTKP